MGAISGIVSFNNLRDIKKEQLELMMEKQRDRGFNTSGTFYSFNCMLGNSSNSKIKTLPLTKYDCQTSYTIIYDGKIYNSKELRDDLIIKGYKFNTDTDEEVIVTGYIHYKHEFFNKLDGVFAIAIYDGKSIILVKDKLGLRPLYYVQVKDKLIFASSIKGLLAYKDYKPIIDKGGFMELIALGPMYGSGTTPFKGIKFIRAGEYLTYTSEIAKNYYYHLPCFQIKDNYEEACNKIKQLLNSAVLKCQQDDCNASFLSGGLDSSIIANLMTKSSPISTYFLDYQNNKEHFIENSFQRSHDLTTALLMAEKLKSNHHEIIINSDELYNSIFDSALNRSLPGMSDIDGSLLLLASKVREEHDIILSGEYADEVFGGYPWCYRRESNEEETFPWLRNLDYRISLLNPKLQNLNFRKVLEENYYTSLNNLDYLDTDNDEMRKWRRMTYLNLYWFGSQLLVRNDTQTASIGLDVRCPFADIALVEYVYNLPPHFKYHHDTEKAILRDAFHNDLPDELTNRKKNPYPKTFDPIYSKLVGDKLLKVLNEGSILNQLFDEQKLIDLTNTNRTEEIPWYGQLMTTPQLIGYFLQLDSLFKEYNITFQLD